MENPLKWARELFNVKQFIKPSIDRALGVDIGSSSIKVVQLRKRRGVAVLETYGEIALGPYANIEIGRATNLPAEKIAEALNDLIQEANVTTKESGISIPFSSSLITLIEMPAFEPKQLAKMIPIEARKYIPVPIGEVTLDWFIVPEGESKFLSDGDEEEQTQEDEESEESGAESTLGKKTNVLLVAIHNEILSKYAEVVKLVKLNSTFSEIEIFSTLRASLDQGLAPVMIMDIGAATTKLYIVEYGIVKVSHIINKGSQDITLALSKALNISVEKAEELKRKYGLQGESEGKNLSDATLLTLQYIFSETNRVLLSYQKKYNKNVSKAVLAGGGSALKGLFPFAEKNLETKVELGNPFAKVETPAFLEELLKEAGPSFTVAVGLALRKLRETE